MERKNDIQAESMGFRTEKKSTVPKWSVVAFLVMSLGIAVVLAIFADIEPIYVPITEGVHIEMDEKGYHVIDVPTPNITEGVNDVKGIILHHTATATGEQALRTLTAPRSRVSCHVMIDTDGTRYVLAPPEAITWHAGKSRLNGRDMCNEFTVGIEFQGNTLEEPLTEDQIQSALDYVIPIMEKYNVPKENIVTHEEIRRNYMEKYPKKKASAKVDVTPAEHTRFMKALEERLATKK